jgi:hypothetical protein
MRDTPKMNVSPELVPIPAGTVFERVEAFADGAEAEAVATTEVVLYSNTLGNIAASTGTAFVSDDIAMVSGPAGCRIKRYEFPVLGKINPTGTGGGYSVDFALYSNCPGAAPSLDLKIPGSAGSLNFTTEANRTVSFTLPGAGVLLPSNNVWFGVKFSRANAGLVVGSPALEGSSHDGFDFPGFPCRGALGGFPDRPHASFHLQLFGTKACTSSFVGYKNNMASGTVLNPGTNTWLVDDILLGTNGCTMTSYEVIARGVGFYEFEMRRNCDTNPIAGTAKFGVITQGNDPRVFRFEVNPPVALPNNFHFATRLQNSTAGIVTSGQQASIGVTSECYGVPGEPPNTECVDVCPGPPPSILPPGIHGGVNLAITCAGEPPVGACCDMFFTTCVGGPDDGQLCCADGADSAAFCFEDPLRIDAYPPCTAPGTCESTCRAVPQMNCPFPPRFSIQRPEWRPNAACEPDPFVPVACGQAACCEPDDECHNLTVNECEAVPPTDRPRQWQIGRICGQAAQHCPLNACLSREGECTQTRDCDNPACFNGQCVGCEVIPCCDTVCRRGAEGRYCCDVCWDSACAELAVEYCNEPPGNDECAPTGRTPGATEITIDLGTHIGTGFTDAVRATPAVAGDVPDDPGIGCYIGNPGAQGLQTVWYKWTAPFTERTRVQTCNSSSPADDSLLVVYAVGDPTDDNTSCNSLIPIACNDNSPQASLCNSGSVLNARTCIYAVAGQKYYAMVASKVAETNPGTGYRIEVRPTSASFCPADPNNNYCMNTGCPDTTPPGGCITDGVIPFDFTPTLPHFYDLEPPAESCIPTATADMWFNYTATCTGALTAHTCGASAAASPDTNLAIYEGCTNCPPYATGPPLACNSDFGGEPCGDSAKVVADVLEGQCYTIRLADSSLSLPTGSLTVSCEQADCPGGTMNFLDPTDGVSDARRPNQPGNPGQLLGTQTIVAEGTPGVNLDPPNRCFTLCETAQAGTPTANSVVGAVEDPPGTYTLTLARPITPGAKTTITYTDTHGLASKLHMASSPANVRGDATSSEQDIQDLSAALNGTCAPPCATPWDLRSMDLDRSEMVTPADILDAADYLAGVGYNVWNFHPNPIDSGLCP